MNGKQLKSSLIKSILFLKNKVGCNGIFRNDEDAWTPTLNVYYFHIKRLLKQCRKNKKNKLVIMN